MKTLAAPLPPLVALRDCAPELARRLGAILLGLAGVIAHRFLKNPRLVLLIVPLWRRLTRIARRFEAVVARQARARPAGSRSASASRARPASLPRGHGWLVRELGSEAAVYGSQMAHVLAGPEMQALIAAVPGVGRVLRPLCRMLGYDLAQVTRMVPPEVLVARMSVPPEMEAAPPVGDSGAVVGDCSDFERGD